MNRYRIVLGDHEAIDRSTEPARHSDFEHLSRWFFARAAMTYSAGLTYPESLAGLIVMSGHVPSRGFIDSFVTQG
jgi:hypothetical protein